MGRRKKENITESAQILKKRRRRNQLLLLGLLIFTFLVFVASVAFGAYSLSIGEVIKTIFTHSEGLNRNIIVNVRIPRCLVACLVGICFSASGLTLQGIMNNPLASPGTIGVNSGAGLLTTVCLVLFPSLTYLQTPLAFVGALFTTLIIYMASWQSGTIRVERMVLIGVAVTFFVNALINAMLIFFPDRVVSTLGFTVGSLSAKSWFHFRMLLPYTAVGFLICFFMSGKMNVLALGDDMAAGLGANVNLERTVLIAVASLMAAAAVSTVGMLGFVGLIVPHITKRLIGSDYRFLYPGTALLGASMVMFCDLLSRVLFAPAEIPVGIILSVVGAPFFLYLLRRSRA